MSTPQEKLIDAIGDVSDKNVEIAIGHSDAAAAALGTDTHHISLSEVKPATEIKSHKARNAVVSGLAAAVAVTGGLFAWSSLRDTVIQPGYNVTNDVTTTTELPFTPDIRNLRWGMMLDEVKHYETAELTREERTGEGPYASTTLIYENVEFEGYNTRMEISVSDRHGLSGVNYYIPTDNCDELYQKLYDQTVAEYGEPTGGLHDGLEDFTNTWEFPDEGWEIYMMKFDNSEIDMVTSEVQYAFWALLPDSVYEYDAKDWEEYNSDGEEDGGEENNSDEEEEPGDPKAVYYDRNSGGITSYDFEVFDRRFYGRWTAQPGYPSEVFDLNYSSPVYFSSDHYDYMAAAWEGEKYAYLVVEHGFDVTMLLIDLDDTDTMYRYDIPYTEMYQGGRDIPDYDSVYTKGETEETEGMSIFGYAKYQYGLTDIEGDDIDMSLDFDRLILDKADEVQKLFNGYLRFTGGDAYTRGDPADPSVAEKLGSPGAGAMPVISDDIKTVADIKDRLTESIYGGYADYLLYGNYGEVDGQLYHLEQIRGSWLGVSETWYTGYDVYDDSIVGHFAVLLWAPGDDFDQINNPDFLNDINSYEFYDITIKNIDGKYVVTDCRGTRTGSGQKIDYDYLECHGCYYNYREADRSLITNEQVKPREYDEAAITDSGLTFGEKREIQLLLKNCAVDYEDDFAAIENVLHVYISSAYVSGQTVTLDMCVSGWDPEAANYETGEGFDEKPLEHFEIKLMKTSDGYRIDRYDDGSNSYIARGYEISSRDTF